MAVSSSTVTNEAIANAMTVDVEDYFQVSAFERAIHRDDWNSLPCRVEANTLRILDLFAEHDVHATFFLLGWVAERYPGLVRRIADGGHEVASHGFSHIRITQQRPDEFSGDIKKTKALLEDISGTEVCGYRAASYSIVTDTLWAHELLEEAGYRYSSSIYPIRHDLYGIPDAPRFAYRPENRGLLEIPITTLPFLKNNLPCGGGGYFRLLPYSISRWAMNQVNNKDDQSCVFYFHPWEIDPDQPRQPGIGWKTRVRHYLNLARMQRRIENLLADFRWDRMDRIFLADRKTDQ